MPARRLDAATKMRTYLQDRLTRKCMRRAAIDGEIAALEAQLVELDDVDEGLVLCEQQGKQRDNGRSS